MKIRSSFVTNSSSSSFIVSSIFTGKELEEKLIKVFSIPESSPLYNISKLIAKNLSNAKMFSLKDYLYNWGYDSLDDIDDKELVECIKNGWNILEGYASNEGDEIDIILCYLAINYKDDELYIYKEEGY